MVHVPLRGLFLLGRAATMVAVAAAIPYILKKNRRLAEQLGDTLIKAGENLRGEPSAATQEPNTAEPVVQAEKPKTAPRASKAAPKSAPKAAPAKSAAKPKTKRPVTAKKNPAPAAPKE